MSGPSGSYNDAGRREQWARGLDPDVAGAFAKLRAHKDKTSDEQHALDTFLNHRIDAGLRRMLGGPMSERAYTAKEACSVTGLSYRQLDWWDRCDIVVPSIRRAAGTGSQRLYSEVDVQKLQTIGELLGAGVRLARIRKAIEQPDWVAAVKDIALEVAKAATRWT